MADNPKDVGKGDRIRASMQKHGVQFIAKKFGISGQAAAGAIRAAGPMPSRAGKFIASATKSGDATRAQHGAPNALFSFEA